jgi:deoxycytidylate deaminase
MEYLSGSEEKKAFEYIMVAAQLAMKSSCNRSRCGSIIVSKDEIIGEGFNSPPQNKEKQRRCNNLKENYSKEITDKTCCIHAEQRAIIDALRKNPDKISGSRVYFIRLGKNGLPANSGKPYCTLCSKMALDVGIKEFILWHKEGVCVYNTEEYNDLSFSYGKIQEVQ